MRRIRRSWRKLQRCREIASLLVFESLGKIPMEEGAIGLDVCSEELIDETAVEVDALGIGCAVSLWEDARPGDGEAIGLKAEGLHELNVFFVEVVMIVGDVAGVSVVGLAGSVGEGIPDGDAAAICFDCAFDLIGGAWPIPRGSPEGRLVERGLHLVMRETIVRGEEERTERERRSRRVLRIHVWKIDLARSLPLVEIVRQQCSWKRG